MNDHAVHEGAFRRVVEISTEGACIREAGANNQLATASLEVLACVYVGMLSLLFFGACLCLAVPVYSSTPAMGLFVSAQGFLLKTVGFYGDARISQVN